MNRTKFAITLMASLFLSPIAIADVTNGKNNHSILQTTKTTALEHVLSSFGDLAVQLPADGKEQFSIVMLYDNQCKYCNEFLMSVPELTANGVTVYVMPFLNHGVYSPESKTMYLAWSTKQPLMSLLKNQLPSQPDPHTAERIFEFTKFAQNQLQVTKTPYILLENGEFIDGFVSPDNLITYLKNAS
ncbi:thioredoxin fold domain-containing protein [Photobacterium leiognathi]|uniref:thioredoxin fold domain-containing protein n=1 Tax=Photobacterium leiognathi TaxID=553611 RepID=UPI002981084D|nr:thioredoxin fold domain-containing protein [Photobacterium leiognathi]